MKHKLGNSTKCIDCFFYRPKDEEHKTVFDGFCKLGTRVNGKRFAKCAPVRWNHGSGCQDWEDAEDRLTHFEVMTRHPDPKRSPIEAELIRTILNPGKEI